MQSDFATATDSSPNARGGGKNGTWQPPGIFRDLVTRGHGALVTDLIDMFKADTDSRLRALDDAVVGGDLRLVRLHAHSIKGSADHLGARCIAAICRQIEAANAEVLSIGLPRQLGELKAECARVVPAMDSYCLGVRAGG